MFEHLTVHDNLTEEEWLALREGLVTSTSMSAILGVSTYKTKFEYWHERNGIKEDFEETDRMKWGRRLESVIAQGIAKDNYWSVRPFKEFLVLEELKAGSSFDYMILDNPKMPGRIGILEIKNVDWMQFSDNWLVESKQIVEAPPYIEVQLMFQLFISGLDYIYAGVFVGGNEPYLLYREPDDQLFRMFSSAIKDFNYSLENNIIPQPDWEKDADFVIRQFQGVNQGTVLDSNGMPLIEQLAEEYIAASSAEKNSIAIKQAAKAQILSNIGEVERVTNNNFSISAKYIAATEKRKGYRNFTIKAKGDWK
jgi:putative phage-type endonuclease